MPAALEATRLSLASLPVIDVLDLTSSNIDARRAVGSRLRAACLDKGFFYIKNHRVEEPLVESVFSEAAAFFALPAEQKRWSTKRARMPIAVTRRCKARRSSRARRPT